MSVYILVSMQYWLGRASYEVRNGSPSNHCIGTANTAYLVKILLEWLRINFVAIIYPLTGSQNNDVNHNNIMTNI
ncbi:hypothetical protein C3B55_00020 [Candidatus Pseudomonas adelgestsugas]|uniref:Uncharacterized protein n=1 Tax=Candidatus Pseudomonas adelgestsugas TaxID=1302376 RepID=A0ABX5R6X9_9PSED|nr:hypothetical protein C3B55_00020 [Candidatus Pseudomonas adelgestsugas]